MLTLSAPAKINLYLHITGKRRDGYHLLDTAFQLIDLCDTVRLVKRNDGKIVLHTPIMGLSDAEHLAVRAAVLLQKYVGSMLGADIWVDKHIPSGAGLGGGSSDAATTLMGLNELWSCALQSEQLQLLGLQLGADVPFFCSQLGTAHALGIGEKLTAWATPAAHYVLIFPNCHVSTSAVFKHLDLTWSEKRAIILFLEDAFEKNVQNDLQAVAQSIAPLIQQVIILLEKTSCVQGVRMSGSGSAVFAQYATQTQAELAVKHLSAVCQENKWLIWSVSALKRHPILEEINIK